MSAANFKIVIKFYKKCIKNMQTQKETKEITNKEIKLRK